VPSKTKIGFPGVELEVRYYKLRECVPGEVVAEVDRRVRETCGSNIVVLGLPEELPDPCALAIAYMHALEHVGSGGRVRSVSLRTLMELLGYKQVREAVEALAKACFIAVIGPAVECASTLLRELVAEEVEVGECDAALVAESVERAVLRGLRGKS